MDCKFCHLMVRFAHILSLAVALLSTHLYAKSRWAINFDLTVTSPLGITFPELWISSFSYESSYQEEQFQQISYWEMRDKDHIRSRNIGAVLHAQSSGIERSVFKRPGTPLKNQVPCSPDGSSRIYDSITKSSYDCSGDPGMVGLVFFEATDPDSTRHVLVVETYYSILSSIGRSTSEFFSGKVRYYSLRGSGSYSYLLYPLTLDSNESVDSIMIASGHIRSAISDYRDEDLTEKMKRMLLLVDYFTIHPETQEVEIRKIKKETKGNRIAVEINFSDRHSQEIKDLLGP